mmetsp:Transcript_21896/g.41445  ORF Transcript_21896/g.41445 Transcript_21896/m.41445 type:complete len:305 (+) Transcript_21896:1414-2328(+)
MFCFNELISVFIWTHSSLSWVSNFFTSIASTASLMTVNSSFVFPSDSFNCSSRSVFMLSRSFTAWSFSFISFLSPSISDFKAASCSVFWLLRFCSLSFSTDFCKATTSSRFLSWERTNSASSDFFIIASSTLSLLAASRSYICFFTCSSSFFIASNSSRFFVSSSLMFILSTADFTDITSSFDLPSEAASCSLSFARSSSKSLLSKSDSSFKSISSLIFDTSCLMMDSSSKDFLSVLFLSIVLMADLIAVISSLFLPCVFRSSASSDFFNMASSSFIFDDFSVCLSCSLREVSSFLTMINSSLV